MANTVSLEKVVGRHARRSDGGVPNYADGALIADHVNGSPLAWWRFNTQRHTWEVVA